MVIKTKTYFQTLLILKQSPNIEKKDTQYDFLLHFVIKQ